MAVGEAELEVIQSHNPFHIASFDQDRRKTNGTSVPDVFSNSHSKLL